MSRIEIVPDGITHLHTEAVVNAANSRLQEGSGVCGAIFSAAGRTKLQAACDAIGGCLTGCAVITPAFELEDAKYIIHAVGPIWSGGTRNEPEDLYNAYYNSLELARKNGCSSIGFPLISAGIYGYPVRKAWAEAIRACGDFLDANQDLDILIRFGVPNESNRKIGNSIIRKIIGEPETHDKQEPHYIIFGKKEGSEGDYIYLGEFSEKEHAAAYVRFVFGQMADGEMDLMNIFVEKRECYPPRLIEENLDSIIFDSGKLILDSGKDFDQIS